VRVPALAEHIIRGVARLEVRRARHFDCWCACQGSIPAIRAQLEAARTGRRALRVLDSVSILGTVPMDEPETPIAAASPLGGPYGAVEDRAQHRGCRP
jgi:hypothetical protein